MIKTKILIVAALVLSFMVVTSLARPDSTLQSKFMETENGCKSDDCLMKTTSDAHLDYIYTQTPPPPHALKVETEKDDLMKTTSDAHLDYIYTQPSPPHALKANP